MPVPASRIRASDVAFRITLALICLVTVYPFYYVLICSLSSPMQVVKMNISVLPVDFYFGSYMKLVEDKSMWQAFGNSVFYAAATTALCCVTALLGAYPLSVKGLIGRKWFVRYLLLAMYFSGGIIPLYILMSRIGLYNTRVATIVPSAVSIWYIMIVRAFLSGIPDSLRESAQIDGAGHFRVLRSIYAPLAKPVLAVVAIYSIVGVWNSWFSSLLFQPDSQLHPLQMYLYRLLIVQSTDLTQLTKDQYETRMQQIFANTQMKFAMVIFTSLPILFTYPFLQRFFIKGVMLGSLKE